LILLKFLRNHDTRRLDRIFPVADGADFGVRESRGQVFSKRFLQKRGNVGMLKRYSLIIVSALVFILGISACGGESIENQKLETTQTAVNSIVQGSAELQSEPAILANSAEALAREAQGLQEMADELQKRAAVLQEQAQMLREQTGLLDKSITGISSSAGTLQELYVAETQPEGSSQAAGATTVLIVVVLLIVALILFFAIRRRRLEREEEERLAAIRRQQAVYAPADSGKEKKGDPLQSEQSAEEAK
jgi:predicted PurR-regulated permease PerM